MKTTVWVCAYIIIIIVSILSSCVYGGGTSQPNYDPADHANSNWMMMGIGSGLCIVLMILSLIAYAIHERQEKTHTKRSRGVKYEILPESSDNTIPHPIQWNEEYSAQTSDFREEAEIYTNTNNIVDMYAKPQPKCLRNKTNEIDDNVNEPIFYSEARVLDSKGSNEAKYAQVVPKNLRNTIKGMNNYANTTSSSSYSEVLPKRHRKNNELDDDKNIPSNQHQKLAPESELNYYNNIDSIPNYDQVVNISNSDTIKYVNVFPNNETYANVNSNSELLEPAYCELNVKT